jgi:hypothetical protein
MPVYFHMPSNYTVVHVRTHVVTKTFGNEKISLTFMLPVLADDSKLPPHIILYHNTIPMVAIFRTTVFSFLVSI